MNDYIARTMTAKESIKFRLNLIERKDHWEHIENFLYQIVDGDVISPPQIKCDKYGRVEAWWHWAEHGNISISIYFEPEIGVISLYTHAPIFHAELNEIPENAIYMSTESPRFCTTSKSYLYGDVQTIKKIILEIYSHVI